MDWDGRHRCLISTMFQWGNHGVGGCFSSLFVRQGIGSHHRWLMIQRSEGCGMILRVRWVSNAPCSEETSMRGLAGGWGIVAEIGGKIRRWIGPRAAMPVAMCPDCLSRKRIHREIRLRQPEHILHAAQRGGRVFVGFRCFWSQEKEMRRKFMQNARRDAPDREMEHRRGMRRRHDEAPAGDLLNFRKISGSLGDIFGVSFGKK